MPLNYKTGAIQWLTTDILNSTQVVTGLGFAPKALKFIWNGLQSGTSTTSTTTDVRTGIGYAVSATSRRTVGSYSQDAAGSSNCGSVAANDCVVITVNGAGTIDGKLDISSFDSDGFTLIVDDVVPANITVFWEAWGGSDITVAEVGDISEPAAIGTVDYTVTGFTSTGENQVIMFAGVQSTAALNTGQAQDNSLNVGFAAGTDPAQGCSMVNSDDDGSASSDLSGANINQFLVINKIIIGGAASNATNAYATLDSWITNGFRLNWLARATTGRKNIYLAIKGGLWEADIFTIFSSTGASINTSFTPIGLNAHGSTFQTTGFTQSAKAFSQMLGMADVSGNQFGNSIYEIDALATMDWNTAISYTSFIVFFNSPNLTNLAVTFNNTGFTVPASGGLTFYMRTLSFGSQTQARIPRTTSVGHPFII